MKLILCKMCQDVFKLDLVPRTCKCGACVGSYLADGLNAVYSGPAVPIGFGNTTLAEAIRNQPEVGDGKEFTAFVIPKKCGTMVKQKG